MYLEFYQLADMPFQLTPDSRFFYGSEQHNRAMAFLNYGILQGEGFVVVTGDVGAGKTTLVDHLVETLNPGEYVSARVVTTQLGSYDMAFMIGSALNLFREGMDKATILIRISQFFAEMQNRGKRVLLIVDESQSLTTEAVEELRMLSNIATGHRAPFQGILLGQPEFRSVLSSAGLEQFRQRVTASYHLGPLSESDTCKYIHHRLLHVGWAGDPLFAESSFVRIYHHTAGIPRRINTLCSRLLLFGFLEGKHEITAAMVDAVADELSRELGGMAGGGAVLASTASLRNSGQPVRGVALGDTDGRLVRLEERVERHERAINRAFELAMRYLPANGGN